MPDISPTLPVVGELCSTADPKILTALSTLISTINVLDSDNITDGALDADTLAAAVAQYTGLSSGGVVRRGACSIDTSEARTNVAYGTLTTPDQVSCPPTASCSSPTTYCGPQACQPPHRRRSSSRLASDAARLTLLSTRCARRLKRGQEDARLGDASAASRCSPRSSLDRRETCCRHP